MLFASRSPGSSLRLGVVPLLALALACTPAKGPGPTPPDGAAAQPNQSGPPKIDPERMFADLEYLSSDELRGRFTFSKELGMAADHLAAAYTEMGLGPVGESYRVPFMAPSGFELRDELTVWVEDQGKSNQVPRKHMTTLVKGKGKTAYAEVVAIGALDRAKAGTVAGKIVVAPAPAVDQRNAQITAFAELGPAGLMLVGDRPPPNGEKSREALADVSLPTAWVSRDTAKEWMGIDATGKVPKVSAGMKMSMALERDRKDEESFNVLAVLPGQTNPEQIVILGAHYDHIGTVDNGQMCREREGDVICNGADDNASGTAMVLEIARAFAEVGYRPARTLVFAHFAGEELGLHGSHAVAETPPEAAPFDSGEVVAMINLDMVGRLGDQGLAVGGISSSDAWMDLLTPAEPEGVEIVYERAVNARSDHANFYRKKIPVLFFFTGLHDDYHQATDHVDKINRDGMAAIGHMVTEVTRAVADGAEVPYAEPRGKSEGVVSRMPGSRDDTVERRSGPGATPPVLENRD